MMDRAGKLKTNLLGEAAYKSFTPSSLQPNPPVQLDNETVELLVKAHKQLALLEGIIEIQKTVAALDTTFKTVSDSVRRLCEMGILTQNSGKQRNRTFSHKNYRHP